MPYAILAAQAVAGVVNARLEQRRNEAQSRIAATYTSLGRAYSRTAYSYCRTYSAGETCAHCGAPRDYPTNHKE